MSSARGVKDRDGGAAIKSMGVSVVCALFMGVIGHHPGEYVIHEGLRGSALAPSSAFTQGAVPARWPMVCGLARRRSHPRLSNAGTAQALTSSSATCSASRAACRASSTSARSPSITIATLYSVRLMRWSVSRPCGKL